MQQSSWIFIRFLLILAFLWYSFSSTGQTFTISGTVNDKRTGESLVGANVFVINRKQGTITSADGSFSLSLPKGKYTLRFTFIGYKTYRKTINLKHDTKLIIELEQTSVTTDEIVIQGKATDRNIKSAQMGIVEIPVKEIETLPAFMGEVDILKTIQLLPGVQSAGEGNTGFYVRGGGPDQNLILLDGATIYNAAHVFGFFSVFNSDAVENFNLIKGGMPAKYGGRLSSVLDIHLKDGNSNKLQGCGGIGLISSRLTLEVPVVENKSSLLISGRRTYFDVIATPFIPKESEYKGSRYWFYDLNLKWNYRLSDKNAFYVSAYHGKDVFRYHNADAGFQTDIPWGNTMTTAHWNHLFSDSLFVNTAFIISNYHFGFDAVQQNFEMKLYSGIRSYQLQSDFTWLYNSKHRVCFGANYIFHKFTPNSVTARVGDTKIEADNIPKQNANEAAVYLCDEYEITPRVKINAGLRGSLFQQIGPFDRYVHNETGLPSDTISYKRGEHIVTYTNWEPRFSMRFLINDKSSLKTSYTQNYQYIHLAAISSVSLPTDLWVPSSTLVKPQFGRMYAIGYFRNFKENAFETSVELYYKKLENQIEYAEGIMPNSGIGDNADNSFTFGKGQSYGIEFFVKKRYGKLTGWIGYTLSKTTRKFPEINQGKAYPAKYDRRHDLAITSTWQWNKNWSTSIIFIFATGNAISLPVGRYLIEGSIVNEYGDKNSFRMANYHRLDISCTYTKKRKGRLQSSWNFSVYNLYNRYNPYFIFYEATGNIAKGNYKVSAKQVSLFPIIPSVTWNFEF